MRKLIVVVVLACLLCGSAQAQLKRLDVSLGLRDTQSGASHSSTYNWALDGLYEKPAGRWLYSLTVDSDYTGGDAELDLLRTWWRFMPSKQQDWMPVFLISTEGDHSLDRLSTLAAVGVRHPIAGGFLEFTAGASKDVKTSEDWKADFGVLVDVRKQWGRFSAGVKPQGKMFTTDEVRVRGGEWRYSVDFDANYALDDHMGLGYHLVRSNLSGDLQSDQFIGITYRH